METKADDSDARSSKGSLKVDAKADRKQSPKVEVRRRLASGSDQDERLSGSRSDDSLDDNLKVTEIKVTADVESPDERKRPSGTKGNPRGEAGLTEQTLRNLSLYFLCLGYFKRIYHSMSALFNQCFIYVSYQGFLSAHVDLYLRDMHDIMSVTGYPNYYASPHW